MEIFWRLVGRVGAVGIVTVGCCRTGALSWDLSGGGGSSEDEAEREIMVCCCEMVEGLEEGDTTDSSMEVAHGVWFTLKICKIGRAHV